MAPMFGLIQADYIYDLEWAEKDDKIFIEMFLGEHVAGNFSPYRTNELAVTIVMHEVNKQLKKEFTLDYCMDRCEVLAKRHRVFSWVIQKHGIRYDPVTNRVYAPNHLWDELVKWDDFSLAYQYYGDPEWLALHQLFNIDDAPHKFKNIDAVDVSSDESDEIEVIEIVDDSVSTKEANGAKLPKSSPMHEPSKLPCGSWNSWDRDFWQLMEHYPYSESGSSEPSVNQSLPPKSSTLLPPSSSKKPSVKLLAPNPPKRPRFPRMPALSPSKCVETIGSTCQGPV